MRNAIQRLALLPIVALFLLPTACHRTDGRAEALLNNADSLLTANPDSALRLLEALPATTELTRRESARYALLLAQATDKCEKPLLPCDSLLLSEISDNKSYPNPSIILKIQFFIL